MDTLTAELAAQAGLERLIERGGEELYEHYLDEKVIPFTLEQFLGMLATGVELYFNRADVGDPMVWPADSEAIPNPVDSWARSHISVRKVYREPVEALPSPISIEEKSIQSGTSYRASTRKPTNALVPIAQSTERPQLYVIDSAIEQPEPELDVLRANKEREIQRRKAELDKERQWKIQREEEARRLDRMASELRNSNFTYDYDGKIVLMKTRPLPSPTTVQYSLAAVMTQTQTVKHQKTTISPKRPVQLAKKTPASELQFVKSINATPNIMELLKVGTGISAFESNRSKKGPEVRSKYMSREEYKALTKAADEEDEECSGNSKKSKEKRKRNTSRKLALEEIPDSDREEELQVSASVPSLLPPRKNLSAVDEFNLHILKSHDWGMNTVPSIIPVKTPLPEKPTPRAARATHGVKPRYPRDRPFVDRKPIRQFPPQPPLGKTMGHGLLEN